ncbi:MAG: flavin prenyltransferase UbiX [Cyanobacteriota bacterium]
MQKSLPIIIGITGASGSIYAFKLIEFLLNNDYKVHIIISTNSFTIIDRELKLSLSYNSEENKELIINYLKIDEKYNNLTVLSNDNIAAGIASGSYITNGMIIIPCSMNTLASIKSGIANSLITRVADVCIKQNKNLLLAPREMPLSSIHLENMYSLSLKGVKIAIPSPAFYNDPQSIDDMINFVTGKILDSFEVPNDLYKRWE